MPAVSVIVPVYNAGEFLEPCVESVLSQTFTDWELLLIDDGSTDRSNEKCRSFAASDSRIRLIEQRNRGVSSARNAGLDMASGRYVVFLDADDELYPDTVEFLYGVAERENVPVVIGRAVRSVVKPAPDFHSRGEERYIVRNSIDVCLDMLYRKPHPDSSPWGRIYSSSLFEGIRFYDGKYEDLEIFHKLILRAGRVAVAERMVYFYRDNPSSFINNWSERRRDAVRVTEGIVARYAGHPVLGKAARNRHFRSNYNLLMGLLRHRPDDSRGIAECYAEVKRLRGEVLSDPHSVFSTRAGALCSYCGLGFIRWLAVRSGKK